MKNVYLNRHRVIKYCYDNRLSINGFCKLCKISPSNLAKHLEEDNKPIKIETLFKISRGTNLGIGEFAFVENRN